jgi:hypothetical protein
VKYQEDRPYAEAAVGMLKLLEIANTMEADQAGLIHIGPINLQFLGSGGGFLEYRAALTAPIERGYLTLHHQAGIFLSPRPAQICSHETLCEDCGKYGAGQGSARL